MTTQAEIEAALIRTTWQEDIGPYRVECLRQTAPKIHWQAYLWDGGAWAASGDAETVEEIERALRDHDDAEEVGS